MTGFAATVSTVSNERLERVLHQYALLQAYGAGFAHATPSFADLCAAYDLTLSDLQPQRHAEPGRPWLARLSLRPRG